MPTANAAESLPYSPELLKTIIRANPDSISYESLRNAFEDDPSATISKIILDLYHLRDAGHIKITGGNKFFTATKPLADLAIARVQDIYDGERAHLKLEGLNNDLPLDVTIAQKQVRQHHLKKDDRIFVKLSRHHGVELKAKYISKLSYKKNPILTGRFNKAANGEVRFVPNDKSIRTTFTANGAIPKDISHDQIFVATIPGRLDMEAPSVDIAEQRWDPQTGNKIAHIIADRHDLRIQHNDDARRSARKVLQAKRPDSDIKSRRVFENEEILAVDPANSPGDIDDGIFAEIVPGRMLRTLVVVTDVASFIHPHTRLDKYALERGRSYYFPQDREFFHMFPEILAIRKMAMRQGHDHPVQYIEQFWDLDSGDLINSTVGLGIVKKHRNLTYHAYQNKLNSDDPAMKAYHEFDRIAWMRDRENNIQLNDRLDDDIKQAKGIVQAMMIRACIGFATALEKTGTLYLRRNHAGHFNDMAYDLASDQLRAWGFDAPYESNRLTPLAINNILMEADSQGMYQKVKTYIHEKLLHRAEYSVRSIGHFGNGAEYYGHFTSPIRRYADLFNQRSFHTAFGIPSYGLTDEMTDPGFAVKVANHLNTVDHRALMVEKDSTRYYAIRYLQKHEGDKTLAIIHNITRNNEVEFLLSNPKFNGLRQSIPAHHLPDDWKVAPNQSGLTYQSRVFFPLYSTLRIKIGNVAPHRAMWNIDEIEPRSVRQKPAAAALPPLRAVG